jgi:sec-independent protein translocase protein TatA
VVGDILQPTHLLFVLVIALLVLGPKRLPEVGRSLGRGLRDFRSAMSGEDDHAGYMTESTDAQPAPAEPAEPAEAAEPPLAAAVTTVHEPGESSH